MRSTPEVLRLRRDGVDGWLHTTTGRWLPAIAGADDTPPPADPPKDPPADPPVDPPKDPPDDTLGDAGKAALEAERTARRDAEKRARDAERRIADAEKAQRDADEKAKQEQGQFKELWETEKARADSLQAKLDERDAKDAERTRKDVWIAKAKTLGFKEPEDAYALLAYRGKTETDDDTLVEAALKALADERSDWVDKRQRSGAEITDSNGGGGQQIPEHLAGVGSGMQRLMRVKRNNG